MPCVIALTNSSMWIFREVHDFVASIQFRSPPYKLRGFAVKAVGPVMNSIIHGVFASRRCNVCDEAHSTSTRANG